MKELAFKNYLAIPIETGDPSSKKRFKYMSRSLTEVAGGSVLLKSVLLL